MKPLFAIITTTYRRPDQILQTLASVQTQSYANWQHIIVIDDPESDYETLKNEASKDSRITVIPNEVNLGKNASVNKAFARLREQNFAGYVIFLDDDDWLAPDCLATFAIMIQADQASGWYVTNRTNVDTGIPFTKNETGRTTISYLYDTLLRHRFGGDVTHCIHFPTTNHITFPVPVKNAEEWVYFAAVASVHKTFHYQNGTGTFSHGYSDHGLTDLYHKRAEQKENARTLISIVWERRLFHPIIVSYILYRFVRSLV
jgi:glycosyltransferase involved in cell wall biosynthesis